MYGVSGTNTTARFVNSGNVFLLFDNVGVVRGCDVGVVIWDYSSGRGCLTDMLARLVGRGNVRFCDDIGVV